MSENLLEDTDSFKRLLEQKEYFQTMFQEMFNTKDVESKISEIFLDFFASLDRFMSRHKDLQTEEQKGRFLKSVFPYGEGALAGAFLTLFSIYLGRSKDFMPYRWIIAFIGRKAVTDTGNDKNMDPAFSEGLRRMTNGLFLLVQ